MAVNISLGARLIGLGALLIAPVLLAGTGGLSWVEPLPPDAQQKSLYAAADPVLRHKAGFFDPKTTALDFTMVGLPLAAASDYGIIQFHGQPAAGARALAGPDLEFLQYLPNNAYVVRWNPAGKLRAQQSKRVRWTGPYSPGLRVDPALWPSRARLESEPEVEIIVSMFSGSRVEPVVDELLDGNRQARVTVVEARSVRPYARILVPGSTVADFVAHAATVNHVAWIERYEMPRLLNTESVGHIQNNVPTGPFNTSAPIWERGIIGTGQIVAITDSGLDRNEAWFTSFDDGTATLMAITDASDPIPPDTGQLFHDRKVIGYKVMPGATEYDDTADCTAPIPGIPDPILGNSFHGTHVTGSVAGDRNVTATPDDPGYTFGGIDGPAEHGGMAPNAQILFQDISHDQTGCLSGLTNVAMWEQARNAGAFIHSNSYGGTGNGVYAGSDAEVDTALYLLNEMVILFAAGNSGSDAQTIGSPGNAKNVITVGALGDAAGSPTDAVAGFSSRGPTADGRTKPDLMAPGSSIQSAAGDDNDDPTEEAAENKSLSGTSMATPTAAGGTALARQYFMDGFYPTGSRNAADALTPTGPLLKAFVLNSTDAGNDGMSHDTGWGHMWLEHGLYFPGDSRELRLWPVQRAHGLATGDFHQFTVTVPSGAAGGPIDDSEFRATLVWYDVPAAGGAEMTLINDLDLEVVTPGGATLLGNVIPGADSAEGGAADTVNTVEQVRLSDAATGEYTIRVHAADVPGSGEFPGSDRSGYGLAVSYPSCDTAVSAAPGAVSATDTGDAGVQIGFGGVSGAAQYQVYRAEGACDDVEAGDFGFIGSTDNLQLTDTGVQGGFAYSYRVRGVDGCGEGPVSACADAVSTAACNLAPQFDSGSVVAVNAMTDQCQVNLSWSAGASACPGSDVSYNIYRGTTRDFVADASSLVATGIDSLAFTDFPPLPEQTFYYLVVAEDGTSDGDGPANSGNLSQGTQRAKVTPTSGTLAAGTFVDNGDNPSYLAEELPWSVSDEFMLADDPSYRSALPGAPTYPNDTCAALTTPPIQLGSTNPTLNFDALFDLELGWDGVVVEITNDGGANWTPLSTVVYPATLASTEPVLGFPINACRYRATQGAFTGNTADQYVPSSASLQEFAGDLIQLRWRLSTDPATEERGFFLDNLQVTDAMVPQACNVAAAPPVVGSVDPDIGTQGDQDLAVAVLGAAFVDGATVDFGAGVTVNSVVFVSSTRLDVVIDVAPGAVPGSRDVAVTNPDLQSATLADGFIVQQAAAPPPQITAVNPSVAGQGDAAVSVVVTGSGFQSGAVVSFGDGISVDAVTVDSQTQISAVITVDAAAAVGPRDVMVANADSQSDTLAAGFAVEAAMAPPPSLASLDPDTAVQGDSGLTVALMGNNFQDGATVDLGAGISVISTTAVSATRVNVTIDVDADAAPGPRDVTITNPDAASDTLADGFTVTEFVAPAPSVSGVDPAGAEQGAADELVDVFGADFADGATVAFGAGVTVSSVTFVSAAQLQVVLDVDAVATTGPRDVTVTNPGGRSGTLADGFTVLQQDAPAPAVSSVNPTEANQGERGLGVTISGSGFQGGATVSMGGGITVTRVSLTSGSQLVATIDVAPDAALGPRDVTVTNADAQSGTLPDGLTIRSPVILFRDGFETGASP